MQNYISTNQNKLREVNQNKGENKPLSESGLWSIVWGNSKITIINLKLAYFPYCWKLARIPI